MKSIKAILTLVLFMTLIQLSFAEILVNSGSNAYLPVQEDIHSFQVNLYYPPSAPAKEVNLGRPIQIVISQNSTDSYVNRCEKANFSFMITNPSAEAAIYEFTATDFKGIVYITPNVYLLPKESKIIDYMLEADCSLLGNYNPKIHVETQDGSEEADIPIILHVENGNYVDESECRFYYNESVCTSPYYIRMNKNTVYKFDLSGRFYDPDGDKLLLGVRENKNLAVDINKNIATIEPKKGWYGKEEIIFYADDDHGGEAYSEKLYFQVLDIEEESSFLSFLANLFG